MGKCDIIDAGMSPLLAWRDIYMVAKIAVTRVRKVTYFRGFWYLNSYFITMKYYFNVYELFERWIRHSLAKLKYLTKDKTFPAPLVQVGVHPGGGGEGGRGYLG